MALTNIQICRLSVGDTDPALPFLADDVYDYYLTKNSNNIDLASLDAAKAILFQLSTRGDETVSIFSLRGSTASKNYLETLKFYVKNPQSNPFISKVVPYASGISKNDMQSNVDNCDNNAVQTINENVLGKFNTVNTCSPAGGQVAVGSQVGGTIGFALPDVIDGGGLNEDPPVGPTP